MTSRSTLARVGFLASVGVFAACPKTESDLAPPPEAPFQLAVSITSDPGHGVGGARVLFKTKPIATSDAAGVAKVEVAGTEGDTVSLSVQCPEGFAAPEKPIVIGLRRLAPGSPPPKFEARCTPTMRTVVVALRAENGFNLPIKFRDQTVAQTDASGIAHFVLRVKPAEPITLTLSTDQKGAEALRPQNPTLQFAAQDQDELVTLEQKFTIQKKRVVVHAAPKPLRL